MLRKLVSVSLFLVSFAFAIGEERTIKIEDAPAGSIEDALTRGLIYGHLGLVFQQSINDGPTYGNISTSLGYESRRFLGYKVGAEMWLIPKLYEANGGEFRRAQTYFEVPQIYGDYYNQYEGFGGTIGRYKTNEEWVTHFVEGASVVYDKINGVELAAHWFIRNAYLTNTFTQNFKSFGSYAGAKWSGGAFLMRAKAVLPQAPITFTPYLYIVPNFFVAPGIKGELDLPISRSMVFRSMLHLTSYVELNGARKQANKGGGGIIWLEAGLDIKGFRFGAGITSIPSGGAIFIEAFGQHTPFERSDGMFYYNATTPYGFASLKLFNNISAYGAFRATLINSAETIINWEAKVDVTPFRGVRLGLGAIGMSNSNANSMVPTRWGGRNYMTFRGYVEYDF